MCFVVHKTISEHERMILTTLYLVGAKKHRQAETSVILTFLVARHTPTHCTLRIRHLLPKKWMCVKVC
jgi:hypothetical protein